MKKYLIAAGVPEHLHTQALASLESARTRAKGLLWHKAKVRFLRAGEIAKLIPWEAERLLDVRPDLASWDIAPMVNITAHGDNLPRPLTPTGRFPAPGIWLDKNPDSAEYAQAVEANYWCKGEHPRSQKSRKAWYRRNGGEYEAWSRGVPVSPERPTVWAHKDGRMTVGVSCIGDAWLLRVERNYGPLTLRMRLGYEIDNVMWAVGVQSWYPIPGHELRAPVTWSTTPKLRG